MMDDRTTSTELLEIRVIERFWETFPPVWHHVRAYVDKAARENNLTMGGFSILRGIRNGKDTVSELAERGHLSRPAISRAVDSLVVKGLVSRSNDPIDRRHIKLALTVEGEQLLASIRQETREWMLIKFKKLRKHELETIFEAFDLLKMSMTE